MKAEGQMKREDEKFHPVNHLSFREWEKFLFICDFEAL